MGCGKRGSNCEPAWRSCTSAGRTGSAKPAADYLAAFRKRNILVAPCGTDIVRFLPPLVIDKEQIDEAVDVFDEVLRQE